MRHDATKHKIPEAISKGKCTNAPTAETLLTHCWLFFFTEWPVGLTTYFLLSSFLVTGDRLNLTSILKKKSRNVYDFKLYKTYCDSMCCDFDKLRKVDAYFPCVRNTLQACDCT